MGDIIRYRIKNLEDPITVYDTLLGSSASTKKTKNFTIKDLMTFIKSGFPEKVFSKVSAESIPSHHPIAVIDNLAYKLDSSNPLHQFSFFGFSLNGTIAGQDCIILQSGEVYLYGWGLIPNQHYLAGINGTLITANLSDSNFTKVIGYATNSNTLQIVNSITINK